MHCVWSLIFKLSPPNPRPKSYWMSNPFPGVWGRMFCTYPRSGQDMPVRSRSFLSVCKTSRGSEKWSLILNVMSQLNHQRICVARGTSHDSPSLQYPHSTPKWHSWSAYKKCPPIEKVQSVSQNHRISSRGPCPLGDACTKADRDTSSRFVPLNSS